MGGWMTYNRARSRNHLVRRPDTRYPYFTPEEIESLRLDSRQALISGDLNRMEQDYLSPKYPGPRGAERPFGSDPAAECARVTGVDVETVRTVLRFVFLEQP